MEDSAILDMYFARSEQAITETDRKYGPYCYSVAGKSAGFGRKRQRYILFCLAGDPAPAAPAAGDIPGAYYPEPGH